MNRNWIVIGAGALAGAALLQGCGALVIGGAAVTAAVVSDRRTTGTYVEDETIEWKVLDRMRSGAFPGAHVNATSYNRRVLLTGEAPTDEAKKQIEERVRGIDNVKEVINELQVGGASSLAARGSDSLTTSNVKARMVNNGVFSPTHVKVLTEGGTVYLMGLVTQAEGEKAVDIARTTSGVVKVVKVFEYVEK